MLQGQHACGLVSYAELCDTAAETKVNRTHLGVSMYHNRYWPHVPGRTVSYKMPERAIQSYESKHLLLALHHAVSRRG